MLAVLAASCGVSAAWAGPTGGQVVGGQAVIQSLNQETLIKQSTNKAIINWNAFSILKNESVVFQQPNASSIALNRVLGGSPSTILGSLSANGQVWLVNPNGVLFGKTATVNAVGLLATTANIANSDFLSGNYNFGVPSANPNAGIANYGTINTAGGSTVLAAPTVDNEGTIEARLGTVTVGAGSTFAVDFDGDNLLSFAVKAPAAKGEIDNAGKIAADGGTIQLTARAAGNVVDNVINTSGIVQANSVSINKGTVTLDAGQGGSVNVSGAVSAAGTEAGTTGGTVKVLGQNVALAPTASVNVSGASGGGTADIGGDFHGSGADPDAANTSIAAGATITADALTRGNGGHIAVWSSQATTFNGSISAQGGPQGGNGGYVETSSAADLSIGTGTVNTKALKGLIGSWLLDPANIDIVSSGGTASLTQVSSFGNDLGQTDSIDASVIDAATSNVILQAKNTIDFEAPVSMTNANVGLTAQADSIIVGNSITTKGGAIVLTADAPGSNQSGSGTLQLAANLNSAGGAVTLSGPTVVGASIILDTATGASNGGGAITFNGTLDDATALTDTLTLKAGSSGNITFNARVGSDPVPTADGNLLAALDIQSANSVAIDIPLVGPNYDGLAAGAITIDANSIAAPGSYISTVNPDGGNAGAIALTTTGNVEIGSGIYAFGTGSGGKGGNVTISAGGNVAVTDTPPSLGSIPDSILGSGATAIPAVDADGIATFGASAYAAGNTPGAGGTIQITAGGNIILPYGVVTAGGNAVFGGSTANGGNGGNVTLTAGGNVYAGVFPATGYSVSGAVNGNIVGIVTGGGFAGDTSTATDGGAGGNAGNVIVTGNQLYLTHIYAEGGATLASSIADPTTTSAGGNITLIGTATSGAAITLYGQSLPLSAGAGPDLLAVAGPTGATFADYADGVPQFTYPSTSLPTGYSGDITIGGSGGGALGGSSFVQLVNNSGASQYSGGAFVTLTTGGSLAKNGTDFGNILVNGRVEGTTAGSEVFDAEAFPGTLTIAGAIGDQVALGGVHLTGNPVNLEGNITTAGGVIGFNDFIPGVLFGGVVLQNNITLDTTAGGNFPGGGDVTFAGTLDDSITGAHNLTITAGAGDVSFLARVGANAADANGAGGTQTGVTPGTVTIESADNINLQIPLDYPNFNGFSVGSFIVEGSGQNCATVAGCTPGASGNINGDGANSSFINTIGAGGIVGPLTIDVGGKIAIGADIFAGGTVSGGKGGNVTLIAGGSVTVGDQLPAISCAPSSSCADPGAVGLPQFYSIFAGGYAAGSDGGSGETAGNGGNVFVQGSSIVLPTGVVTSGGAAIIDGATGPGGNAGTIQLTATNGNVWAGVSPTSGAANGNIAVVVAVGGSAANAPGNGADVTIQGRQLYLTNVLTFGGDTELTTMPSGSGVAGNITLLATQLSGPAVTLYGEFDPATGTPTQSTLDAFGGETGGTSDGSLLFVNGGTVSGQGGNIVIAGGGSAGSWQPLATSAYVQLVNNSANSGYKGGPTFNIVTGGGSGTTPPSILIDGAIEGTTAGAEALRLDNLINTATPTPFGSIEVNGTIGAQTPLGYVSFFGTPIDLVGNVTTLPGVLTDVSGSNAGNLDYVNGAVLFNGAVQLQNDVTINTAGGDPFGSDTSPEGGGYSSGDIIIGNIITSSVNGAHALVLDTGGSNSGASVIFCSPTSCTAPYQPAGPTNVGQTTPLAELLVRAGDFIKLQTVTTTGSQYYVTGNPGSDYIYPHYNLTATGSGSDIQFLGNVDALLDNIAIKTAGTISGGEIYVSGALSGDTSTLTLNAGQGLISYDGAILTQPVGTAVQGCPSGVTCDEGPTQTLSGTVDTGTLNQSAHILLTGNTTFENETGSASNALTITPTIDSADGGLYNVTVQQRSDTTGGIALAGTVGAARTLGSLTVTGTSGTIAMGSVGSPIAPGLDGNLSINNEPTTLGGVISTKDGDVSFAGPVTLAGNLAIDTTVFDSGNGAAINFNSTIEDSAAGAHSLSLNAGDYTIALGGNVGDTMPLGPVSIVAHGPPAAQGCVTSLCLFGDIITLGGKISIDAPTYLDGNLTLSTVGTNAHPGTGADIVLSSNTTVDTDPSSEVQPANFSLNAGTGAITVGANLGGNDALGDVTLTSSSRINLGGNIDTDATTGPTATGAVTINGPTVLTNSVMIDTTDGGNFSGAPIMLNGTVDAQSVGVQSLALSSGNGTITVGGAIGGVSPLGVLSFSSNTETTLNADSIVTSDGAISFSGPIVIGHDLSIDTTARGTSPNGGADIAVGDPSAISTVEGASAGAEALTMTSGTGFIYLYTSIGDVTPLKSLMLTSDNQIGIAGSVGTTGAIQLASPQIYLGLVAPVTYTTAGGPITFDGASELYADVSLDTTAGGNASGANVTFGGTLDDITSGTHTLNVAAGTGDVNFKGRVGRDVSGIGSEPGAVTITSADNVNLTMPYGTNGDGFQVESLSVMASGSLDVSQGYISTSQRSGSGGNISISTDGGVYVAGEVEASSGASGGNGGNVTIAAGGEVAIFGCCTLSQFGTTGTGDEQIANTTGIYTAGYSAAASGQTAGNGGNISITGSSINLPLGAASNGGSDVVANSTGNGGKAGSIQLTATAGNVSVGDAPDNGDLTGLYTLGGNSAGGVGGNGGNVSLTASDQISLSRILAIGGSTESTSQAGGNGGTISLAANATTGAAILLYGNADSVTQNPALLDTLNSRGGYNGVTFPDGSTFFIGGAISGNGGNISIGSGTADNIGALKGSSYIQLEDDSQAAGYEGGSTVFLLTQGTNNPSITVLGSIEGTNAGAEALRIGDLFGPINLSSPIGDQVALGYVSLDGAPTYIGGNITTVPGNLMLDGTVVPYSGDVYVNGPVSLEDSATIATNGGNITFGNVYAAPVAGTYLSLTLNADGQAGNGAILFDPGSTVGATTPVSQLSITGGSVTLQDVTADGNVSVTGMGITLAGNITTAGSVGESTTGVVTITGPVTLANPVTVDTTDGDSTTGSNISFSTTVDAGNGQGLNLNGGAGGTVTVDGTVGGNSPNGFGPVTVSGASIDLNANIDTAGHPVTLDGQLVFTTDRSIDTTTHNSASGANITLDTTPGEGGTDPTLTLNAGTGGAVDGSIGLGQGYFLNLTAANSTLTGTVNGASGSAAAQYVTANNGCSPCTINGIADGTITTGEFVTGIAPDGSTVDLIVNGSSPSSTTAGPNGAYQFLLTAGTTGAVLVYLPNGAADAVSALTGSGASALNLTTANAVYLTGQGGTVATSNLATAEGTASGTGILYSVSNHTILLNSGIGLNVAGGVGGVLVDDAVVASGGGAVTLNGASIALAANITTANGAITLTGPVSLTGTNGAVLTLDTTAQGQDGSGANISVSSTVDAQNGQGLTLNGGTGGTVTMGGAVGANSPNGLGPLTISGGGITLNASIASTGALTLNAGGAISAVGAINVGAFILQGGNWSQVASTLPAFAANDFELQGGTFIRALGGDGTPGSPYQIADVYGLQGVGTLLSDSFELANAIDATGTAIWNGGAGFAPIGNDNTGSFTGSLNGQGNAISNLAINSPLASVGLFGTNSGTVTNLILANAAVSSSGNGAAAGTLAGINTGTITNSSATGSVTGTSSAGGDAMLGGLVGYNNGGTINGGSFANVTVADNANYGDDYLGGLVGRSNGTIEQSYASGPVTGTGSGVDNGWGGLVGALDGGTIDQSYALGEVTNNSGYVPNLGGLVGKQNSGAITNSYASGAVVSHDAAGGIYIGGLVGWQTGGSIASSYSVGLVQCPNNGCSQGGMIGVGGGTVDALSFWDVDSSGQATSAGGTGLTTAQAQSATYLESMNGGNGWSFSGTSPWRINDGSSYPYLVWRGQPTAVSEIVSGIAPDGSVVDLIVDGATYGSTTAADNGAYQFQLTSGTTGVALVYLPSGTADAVSALTGSGAAGLNLTNGNTVYLTGQGGTVATSNLATAVGSASGPGILYGVNDTGIVLNSGIALIVAGGSGGVVVDEAVVASGGGAVTINGASIALAANIATAGGAVTLVAPLTLTGNSPVLTLDTTAQGQASSGANISLGSTVDAQNGQGLTLNGGTGGTVTIGGVVGGNSPSGFGPVTINAATIDLNADIDTAGQPITLDGQLVFASDVTVGTTANDHPNGANITLNDTPQNTDTIDPTLTLDAGSAGAVNGTVNLGQGYFLTLNAGSSNLTGTVNGASGGAAAQYITLGNNCGGCTFNGAQDGSQTGGNGGGSGNNNSSNGNTPQGQDTSGAAGTMPQSNPNTNPDTGNQGPANQTTSTEPTTPQEAVVVQQSTYEPPPPYEPGTTDAPTTVSGIDSGASLFVSISPNSSADLTVSQSGSDQVVVAYANPPPVKPAATAEPQKPQVVHPVAAYLNRMETPTVPSTGVPGISFGYSLSGNSALW